MSTPSFDPKIVRALAEILADTGLTEIEVETKEGRVRIARTPAAIAHQVATPAMPRRLHQRARQLGSVPSERLQGELCPIRRWSTDGAGGVGCHRLLFQG